MGPYLVIFLSPVLYQYVGLEQCSENVPVQQSVPQLAVEGLYIPIFPWAARCYEQGLDPKIIESFANSFGGKLASII
jgi:hypothetical protein